LSLSHDAVLPSFLEHTKKQRLKGAVYMFARENLL